MPTDGDMIPEQVFFLLLQKNFWGNFPQFDLWRSNFCDLGGMGERGTPPAPYNALLSQVCQESRPSNTAVMIVNYCKKPKYTAAGRRPSTQRQDAAARPPVQIR